MTKRESAIVSAYTGYLIGDFDDFHTYAEEIMGRSVCTHEFPYIADELKDKSKKDFMSIEVEDDSDNDYSDLDGVCTHIECPYFYRCEKKCGEIEACTAYMDI